MKVISYAAGVLLAALLLSGCSSLNPFSSSKQASFAASSGDVVQPRARRAPESARLVRFDANGDAIVTRTELETALAADFKKDDVNGNEMLDTDEARALNERLRKEEGTSPVFDWNADGRLVYSEFASQWRTLFERADRDRDGVISDSELKGGGRDRTPRELPKPEMSRVDPSQ